MIDESPKLAVASRLVAEGKHVVIRDRYAIIAEVPPHPPSLPYKVDTSRPSLRTNWTRLVPFPHTRPLRHHHRGPTAPRVFMSFIQHGVLRLYDPTPFTLVRAVHVESLDHSSACSTPTECCIS